MLVSQLPDRRREGGDVAARLGVAATSPRSAWRTRPRRPTARSTLRSRRAGTSRPTRRSDQPTTGCPYPGHPFAQTHPDRLATVATLFGLRAGAPGGVPAARTRLRRRRQPRADGLRAAGQRVRRRGSLGHGAIERADGAARALGLDNVELSRRRPDGAARAGRRSTTSSPTACTRGSRPRRATRCSPRAARTWRPAASRTSPTTCCPAGTCARSRARSCAGTCATSTIPQERIAQARALLTAVALPARTATSAPGQARVGARPGRLRALPRRAAPSTTKRSCSPTSSPRGAPRPATSSPRPTCSRCRRPRCRPELAATT